MKMLPVIYCSFIIVHVAAQLGDGYVKDGNDAYRNGDYKRAAEQYQKALAKDPVNIVAKFNMGNALQKQNDAANAIKQYDDILNSEKDAGLRAKTLYNKGLAMIKQNDLAGAVDAFKQALGLTPDDNDIRENLQKALNEQKQKQQKQQQNKQDSNNKKQPPQKQPSKQMMEQKFSELRNQEKQLQKQLQKKPVEGQPEKDW